MSVVPAPAADPLARYHACEAAGDLRGALGALDAVLATGPANAEWLALKGDCHVQIGRPDQAAESYVAAFKVRPDAGTAYQAAETLTMTGDYAAAEYYGAYTVKTAPVFLPGIALLAEIELGLWHLDNARQTNAFLAGKGGDAALLADELLRREHALAAGGGPELFGDARGFFYLKTGTMMTGGAAGDTEGPGETVLTLLDENDLGGMHGRAGALLRHAGIVVAAVLPVGADPGTDAAAQTLAAALAVPIAAAGGLEEFAGRPVLLYRINYAADAALAAAVDAVRAAGGQPYLFTLGMTRAVARRAQTPPDIMGAAGTVALAVAPAAAGPAVEGARRFMETGGPAAADTAAWYEGPRGLTRLAGAH